MLKCEDFKQFCNVLKSFSSGRLRQQSGDPKFSPKTVEKLAGDGATFSSEKENGEQLTLFYHSPTNWRDVSWYCLYANG